VCQAKKADELKEKLDVATKKIEELEGAIKGLRGELEKAKKDSGKALADVEANFKSELAAKLEELKAELLAQGSKDAELALAELKEKLAADKQAALDKLQAKHDAELEQLKGAQGSLEQDIEKLKAEILKSTLCSFI
jgi:chromosome segregation ATPase